MAISLEDAKAVAYLYEASLNRKADLPGLNFWIDIVDTNKWSLQRLATEFFDSDEFNKNFADPDTLSNAQLITLLYQNILGRDPEQAGFDFWVGILNSGTARNEVLYFFAVAPENTAESPYIDTLKIGVSGDYEFDDAPPPPVDIPGDASTMETIEPPGGTVSSDLGTPGDTDWFKVELAAGDRIQINLTGDGADPLPDPLVRVFDSGGFELANDDDDGRGLNGRLIFTAPADGTYFISAEGTGGDRTGTYSLTVQPQSPDFIEIPGDNSTTESVTVTDTFVGVIDFNGDTDRFVFDVTADMKYRITMNDALPGDPNGVGDPLLRVFDEQGTERFFNDDFGGTSNAQIQFQATSTERLFLSAEAFSSNTGEFVLIYETGFDLF